MRKQIQKNLISNSYSAFYSAIEIHNKPNFSYRYETVVILLLNAWELILKAFARKYTNNSIFNKDGTTISIDKCLVIFENYINSNKLRLKYISVKNNILLLEEYRNNCIHYYNDKFLDPILFGLISKSIIDFNNFNIDFFGKDPITMTNLYISPIGFKLPFNPIDFINKNYIEKNQNSAGSMFLNKVVNTICILEEEKAIDSIVIGFDLYLNSIKKIENSDLIVAIDNKSQEIIGVKKVYNLSNDEDATKFNITDDEWFSIYKYGYHDLANKLRKQRKKFKQNSDFNKIIREIKKNPNYSGERKLDPFNPKTVKAQRYSEEALNFLLEKYK